MDLFFGFSLALFVLCLLLYFFFDMRTRDQMARKRIAALIADRDRQLADERRHIKIKEYVPPPRVQLKTKVIRQHQKAKAGNVVPIVKVATKPATVVDDPYFKRSEAPNSDDALVSGLLGAAVGIAIGEALASNDDRPSVPDTPSFDSGGGGDYGGGGASSSWDSSSSSSGD